MGRVLSAPAPALIHHPESSSVSFWWRHPKQGALITAARWSHALQTTTLAWGVPTTYPSPTGQLCLLGLLLFHHQLLVFYQLVTPSLENLVKRNFTSTYKHVHTVKCTHVLHILYAPYAQHGGLFQYICRLDGYLRSQASPIIDFKWKVSHWACRG